jgi:hypothetical protein
LAEKRENKRRRKVYIQNIVEGGGGGSSYKMFFYEINPKTNLHRGANDRIMPTAATVGL